MRDHFFIKLFFALLVSSIISPAFAETISDPCTGLLALINRPSVTGSACAVPARKILVEGGYQYLNLSGNAHGYITPQAIIRFGMANNNEFLLSLPSYFHQTNVPRAGWSSVSLSLKHEIGYNANWLGAFEGILGVPSGSANYGSREVSGAVDAIVTYTVNPFIGITGTLGVMSNSVQYIQNGKRFTSINPDVIATYQFTDKAQLFGEMYAQTRTGPGEGLGLLAIGGLYYWLTPRIALDAEWGQRVTGAWGFQSYMSGGAAVLFG